MKKETINYWKDLNTELSSTMNLHGKFYKYPLVKIDFKKERKIAFLLFKSNNNVSKITEDCIVIDNKTAYKNWQALVSQIYDFKVERKRKLLRVETPFLR